MGLKQTKAKGGSRKNKTMKTWNKNMCFASFNTEFSIRQKEPLFMKRALWKRTFLVPRRTDCGKWWDPLKSHKMDQRSSTYECLFVVCCFLFMYGISFFHKTHT